MDTKHALTSLLLTCSLAVAAPHPAHGASAPAAPSLAAPDEQADDLLDQARDAIEEGRYDRAIDRLDRLISRQSGQTDAAIYWKAYSLKQIGRRSDALAALDDLYKRFPKSSWVKSAKALEIEVRQASGQSVAPDSQNDDELKLLALRGLMESSPDEALPTIEKMLAGSAPIKIKDRALFVLSQTGSPRAHALIANVAKGGANPDLQLRAIRYLGIMGGDDNRQLLADVYKASSDRAVRRAILRSYMVSGDRERLFALAKGEPDPALRADAVQQLGVMNASGELQQLYQTETATDVKKRILQAMFVGGDSAKLIELAKTEKDPELRKTAIHNLGLMNRSATSEALVAIYKSDQSADVRKAVVQALFLQNDAAALVALARAEKDPEVKKAIVASLSIMPKSKEATDYLMELLK